MDWFVLAEAAAEAVSQVLVIVGCGIILSKTGYLSQSAQKSISQVNLYFMTPCLLFTKIASTINWQQFKAFWPIPVFYLFFSTVSWIVAKIGSRLLRFSADEEKFVTASILFSNTNSLPMALIQSLAMSAAGSHLLRDENDTMEQVAARGISYILFYAIFGNLVRWSYGFSLLVPNGNAVQGEVHIEQTTHTRSGSVVQAANIPREGVLIDVDGSSKAVVRSASSESTLHNGQESYRDETGNDQLDRSQPRLDNASHSKSLHKSANQHQRSTQFQPRSPDIPDSRRTLPVYSQHRQYHLPSTVMSWNQKASSVFSRIRQVLTPPLVTALIALVIGLIPSLHWLFMSPESKVYAFIVHPVENCGAAAIPMILLCLGAQVVHFATSSVSEPTKGSVSTPTRPGPPQRRRSLNTPSVFAHADSFQDSSSSEDEDSDEIQDHGWLRVQGQGRSPRRTRESYGQNGVASSRSHASSSATLYHFEDSDDEDSECPLPTAENGSSGLRLGGSRLFKCVTPVGFILFARMVMVPMICLPAILFHPQSLSPILTMDPTFTLSLVLLVAAPTAINMIQLCQIKGFFEEEMAAVLFWSYCIFGIPCVLGWSLVGLWAAGR